LPISSSFNTRNRAPLLNRQHVFFVLLFVLLFLLGLYFRTSGLFRGLGDQGSIFHPDEPKQILALFNFLNGDYLRYYGSLFYDGYPYGLNHLDEYLLRPLLFLFGSDTLEQHSLYYYGRLLRLLYSMVIMAITYQLTYKLVNNRTISLLALLLITLAPLSITVTHFSTGDIGVDLFSALCFLFLLFHIDKTHKLFWIFCCGLSVGGAFSAKYNGLLVGMVPAMVLCFDFSKEKQLKNFTYKCFILGAGTALGVLVFTPGFLLDPRTTLGNMVANFEFIKNYNVPADILARSWIERAFLGLSKNSVYIISSLGTALFLSSLLGIIIAGKKYVSCFSLPRNLYCSRNNFILSLALFPLFSLLIAMSGKYVVQPFHFSYLLVPLIVVFCVLVSQLFSSGNILLRACALLLATVLIIEFGLVSSKENFFWRLEDNGVHAQNLPPSIYDREAFYTHRSETIRSLYLEPTGNSVFRNYRIEAKGPDAPFWKMIEVAPLPQVPNPVGNNWIFLNGPTFPRNERMLVIHGENHGKSLKRYLVLPAGQQIAGFGIRCGSFATEAFINFGQARIQIQMEAHQQKTISLTPQTWRVSGEQGTAQEVHIIPLEVFVPHNDLWITILTSQKEKQLFTLFGGGQDGTVMVPEAIPVELKKNYFDALSRIRYLDSTPSWRVTKGKRIPMWEVALPAGRYTLICEVDGLVDASEIAIEFEDAKGKLHRGQQQSFPIKKGIQRIEYSFTKAFAPYQTKFIISGKTGSCQMLFFKLTPDYHSISDDFDMWRKKRIQPDWISRFSK
jgi:Dolichyl-phosphate-mannose-protein mannosyltransferase